MAVDTEAEIPARVAVTGVMILGLWIAAPFAGALRQRATGLQHLRIGAAVRFQALVVCGWKTMLTHPSGMTRPTVTPTASAWLTAETER